MRGRRVAIYNGEMIVLRYLYVVALIVWVGGLVGLAQLMRRASGAAAAARFSGIAAWALVATVASVAGWYRSGLLDGLLSTGYGRVIIAKIAAASAMASGVSCGATQTSGAICCRGRVLMVRIFNVTLPELP